MSPALFDEKCPNERHWNGGLVSFCPLESFSVHAADRILMEDDDTSILFCCRLNNCILHCLTIQRQSNAWKQTFLYSSIPAPKRIRSCFRIGNPYAFLKTDAHLCFSSAYSRCQATRDMLTIADETSICRDNLNQVNFFLNFVVPCRRASVVLLPTAGMTYFG